MQSCFGFFFLFLLFLTHTNLQNLWQIIHQHLKVKVVVIIIKSKFWLNWLFLGSINLGIWFHFSLTTRRTDRSSRLNFGKFTKKLLSQRIFFGKVAGLKSATFFKKDSVQVLSCEFCEIFKNNFFTGYLWCLLQNLSESTILIGNN